MSWGRLRKGAGERVAIACFSVEENDGRVGDAADGGSRGGHTSR